MEKNKPLVTIVTLSYNKLDYIFQTIDSALNQDYPNIEYIISDDGTEDFPEKKICDYICANKRNNLYSYRIIRHSQNVGTVRNLNNACKCAKGDFIIPLSADDEFTNEQIVSSIIDRMNSLNSNVLVCSRVLCDLELNRIRCMPRKEYLHKIEKLDTSEKQYKAFATSNYYEMASGSVLYLRKSFIDGIGYFDESFYLWEDGPFFVKCTGMGYKIDTAYDIDAIYYRTGGVSSGKPSMLMLQDMKLLSRRCMEDSQKLSYSDRRRIKFIYEKICTNNTIKKNLIQIKYIDVCLKYAPELVYKKIIENKK